MFGLKPPMGGQMGMPHQVRPAMRMPGLMANSLPGLQRSMTTPRLTGGMGQHAMGGDPGYGQLLNQSIMSGLRPKK